MANASIVLSGSSPTLQGLSWESANVLRIGRQANMDIILQDVSVARVQGEVRKNGNGWMFRDLANSSKYPSLINGVQLQCEQSKLSLHDQLQFGRLKLKVSSLAVGDSEPQIQVSESEALSIPKNANSIKTSMGFIRVEKVTHQTWDQSLQAIVADSDWQERQDENLLTLLRTGHHLCHISSLDELLDSVLEDAIKALGAQRGAIVLADSRGSLELRAVQAPELPSQVKGLGYSRTLAQRCFAQGESLLCQDVSTEKALLNANSVRRGGMMSMICVVLRSPRQRLGVLHLDRGSFQDPFTPRDLYLADAIAASIAVGIESAQLVERQREEFIAAVTSLARTVEMRDQYTGDHTRRVTDYSVLLARELGLNTDDIYRVQIGTPLHDIGKIGVNDEVLRKPGRLTSGEFEMMKSHTIKGADIIASMKTLDPMIPIVRHHHERWDGAGYPDGLSHDSIPQIARVVAVADAFDAMTSNRPYRKALPTDHAFAEICKNAGSHFDPGCVEAFLRLRPRIEERMLRSAFSNTNS